MKPDEHLRAALRHAPDADVQAPPLVSARILAAARQAVDEERPWWQRVWRSPLGASGAFATVLMAGVIGLLWQGEPPPVAEPEAAVAPLRQEDAPAAVPAQPAPNPMAKTAPPSAAPPERQRSLPAPAPAKALEDHGQPAAPEADRRPAPASPPEPSQAEARIAAVPAPQAPAQLGRTAAPAAAWSPLVPWQQGTVSWQLQPDAEPAPADMAWLRALDEATAARWQPAPDAAGPEARHITLLRDGAQARLLLEATRVLFCAPGEPPACHAAPLDEATARALLARIQR